jgi:hypothetical protein
MNLRVVLKNVDKEKMFSDVKDYSMKNDMLVIHQEKWVYEIPLVNVLYLRYHTQKDVQKESPKEKITVGAGEQYNSRNNTSDITVTGNPYFPKWTLDNTPDDDNLRKEYVKEENLVGNSTMRITPSYEDSFFKIDLSKNKDTIPSNNVVIADNEF